MREVDFVREHIRAREQLRRHFGDLPFVDPVLMILLHLFLAQEAGEALSVKQTCGIAGVPNTTALRWIASLEEEGLLTRTNDPRDGRCVLITMTSVGYEAVRAWSLEAMAPAAPV